MTNNQVGPIIEQVNELAARAYPSTVLTGSAAAVSPNLALLGLHRPDGDVHVGNVEHTRASAARAGWQRLRDELAAAGFTVTDCRCGVYEDGDCFVATAPAT